MRSFRQVLILPGAKLTGETIARLGDISDEHPYVLQKRDLLNEMSHGFKNADALIASWQDKIDEKILQAVPSLRFIALRATTTANIDMHLMRATGITVSTITHYSDISAAEFVIGQLFQHFRHSRMANQQLPEELSGHSIALIGLGMVGSYVARYAHALGMHVSYFSPRGPKHDRDAANYDYYPLEKLLGMADIVSFHSPPFVEVLSDRQLHLIDPSALVIATTLGLPFPLEAFCQWQTSRSGTSIFDLCAAHQAIADLRPLPGVNIVDIFSGRTEQSTRRAESQLLQNCRNYLNENL